jgi:hypothetical protein
MGDLYLNMVESKNKETSGFDRQSLVLFADDLSEFLKGFDEALKVLDKAQREKKKNVRRDRSGEPTEQRAEGNRGFSGRRYNREDSRESVKRSGYSERRWDDTIQDNFNERNRRYSSDSGHDSWNRRESNRPSNGDKDSSTARHGRKRFVIKRQHKKNED